MKSNLKVIIVAIAIAFVAVSCGGGKSSAIDAALSQIEKTMSKIEKNKTSMTEADWEALSKELEQPFKVLNEAVENDQIGTMKKLKITAVMMRWAAVAGEAAIHTATDKMNSDEVKQALKEIKEAVDNDEVKEAMQELQKVAKQASEE